MKNRISVTLATLILFVALAATSAFAQTSENFTVDVPFDFTVGSKTFAAGEYDVRKMNESSTALMVRSSDGRQVMVFLTISANAKGDQNVGQLVFNKYGHQYFLTRVQRPGGIARGLIQSSRERNLRKELAAARNLSHETVTIAARFTER
ncbi:MAG TPA: hypothetical protein VM866_01640 [Pyrinomonadaceae bacterium]|jgi:hypothetical protein|nr:hypothetical protein [Pyrinomonadaceae bacterium]